ncbi:MAG: hypothetical protein KGN78_04835 [Actinomycetales bacterium]|nr:hypothetical protein [Actinomycetales bacterium]
MADPSQYFVLNSGDVHVVKPENIEEAKRRGLVPATEEQRRQYDLVQEAKKDPFGAVKAGAQALGEGVVGMVGLPTAAFGLTPSIPALVEKYVPESIKQAAIEQFGEAGAARAAEVGEAPSLAELSEAKRMQMLRGLEGVTPTLPRIQQELGLRTAEEIKAEAQAFPVPRAIGTVASFFVGPAVSKLLKTTATKVVPVLAAEETLKTTGALSDAVTKAVGLDAKNAAYRAAESELAAAQATRDAVQIAAKQAAFDEAAASAGIAADDAAKLRMALLAEADTVPAELAPLVTKEVQAASKTALKSAERMSLEESQRLLANVPKSQRAVADRIKSLQEATISSPAITSKIGTDAAKAIEQSALARLQRAPGFSTALAEADVAAAKLADDAAVGAEKLVTAERLKQANESLATLKVRQELTAKAIGLGLGRSAEMMMFGLQGVANEMALGDPALVAESAYATLGFDAGLGAGFGLAEALAPPTLRAGLRAAKATGNKIKDVVGKVYPEIASFITGAEPETIRAVMDAKEDLAAKGLRRVIEESTPMPVRPAMPPEIAPPVVPPPVPKPPPMGKPVMPPPVPRSEMPPPVPRPYIPTSLEPVAVAGTPLKPVDYDAVARELRGALEQDIRQIAAPKKGGLLYDANTEWRKVQINQTIRNRLQKQTDEMVNALYESKMGEPLTFADEAFLAQIESGEFINTPYRNALKDLIGRVKSARQVAKTYGMTGEMVPSAQEAAYKVNRTLEGLEDRLTAFEAANPTPEQIFQEMKWVDQELFYKRKEGAVFAKELALLPRQVNAAYGSLKQDFKNMVLNKDLWGDAAVLESEWKADARRYYAGLKNLKKAAPKLVDIIDDPVTGLPTELIVDAKKLKSIVKNINADESARFRDALGQYFEGRRALVDRIVSVSDYVKANVDKGAVVDRMAATERAYDRAIQNAVNDASNAAIEESNALAAGMTKDQIKAARKAKIEEIKAVYAQQKADRQMEVEELRGAYAEAKEARRAEVEQIKSAFEEAKEAQKIEFEAAKEARAADILAAKQTFEQQVKARDEIVAALKEEYSKATAARQQQIVEQINLLRSASTSGSLASVIKFAVKAGAPVLGGATLGPLGALGGAALSAASSPVTTAKTLAKLNKAMITVSDKVGGVANMLTGTGAVAVKTGEALGSFATRKKLDEEYKKVERRVRELTADNDALMDQQDAMLANLADDAPNIADATKTVNATALQYLTSKKPQPPATLAPMQLIAWEPVDADKRKFLRITDAVMNPLETLELAGKGALLPEQIDALNAVYPSLMADVRSKLLERIEQTGKVPEKHRMMVSMLLGKDIDGRMQAAKIVPAQSVYGQQRQVDAQKQAQAQMPMTRAQRLNLAERAEYEGSARRNAQLK